MASTIRSYPRGTTVTVGVTVSTTLGAQANPTNGVKVTITRAGAAPASGAVAAVACTQAQYDEDNATTTGQYRYDWQSGAADLPGKYVATFTIDPTGTYVGIDTVEFMLT